MFGFHVTSKRCLGPHAAPGDHPALPRTWGLMLLTVAAGCLGGESLLADPNPQAPGGQAQWGLLRARIRMKSRSPQLTLKLNGQLV